MDFITKLPKSKDPVTRITYDSIIVIVDRFTKYLIAVPEACEDSNLHTVQAGNLGAAMAGSLPSCL